VDAKGNPVAGAKVTGALRLTLLIFAQPGGYNPVALRRRFEATSGEDGRYELAGLTKGMYELRIESPGRARAERSIPVGPDFRASEVEVTLDQGDAISGVVRDAAGRPIAGAKVHPARWHHSTPNGGEVYTTPSGASPAQTDAEGRYRLGPLRQGGYTLEVTSPGFKPLEIESVPAGNTDTDVTLERP
jgi:hypothetical protein